MKSKTVVVYMDGNDRCRVLVNPDNPDNFIGLNNAVINPDIKALTDRGIGPDRWIVENGELSYNNESKGTSSLTLYDITAENKQLVIRMKKIQENHEENLARAKKNLVIIYLTLAVVTLFFYFRGVL